MPSGRLSAALAEIDRANAEDPNTVVVDGVARPKEQAHAELMTAWIERLAPDADDAQLLAARAHHLRRWEVPRDSYPQGRAGYLRWRADAKRRHADEVGGILERCGYDARTIARVQEIIRKEDLRGDPGVQLHEDALCLVFLQTQLADVVRQLGVDKAAGVLVKTLAKMTARGRAEARALPLGETEHEMVVTALEEVGG